MSDGVAAPHTSQFGTGVQRSDQSRTSSPAKTGIERIVTPYSEQLLKYGERPAIA